MKNDIFSKNGSVISSHKATSEEQQHQFISNLRQAICNNELRLHYQPRYNRVTGKADILEALVRWRRPGVGLFYPEVFLATAEQNGLIFSLDFWVFEQCCVALKHLHETVDPALKMAVNISVLSCESIYYAQKIIEVSEKHGVLLSDFEFEISQSMHGSDVRKVNAFCETLINYGAVFSLDDFGVGGSALSNLSVLPVSKVKIDQGFVHGIGLSERCEIMIPSLIAMIKELGMQAVAGGIENNAQYSFMREAGCELLQGFLLAAPTKLENINLKLLTEPVIPAVDDSPGINKRV